MVDLLIEGRNSELLQGQRHFGNIFATYSRCHPTKDCRSLDNEREDVGVVPKVVRKKRVSSRHEVLPREKGGEEGESDNQRSDEPSTIPTLDRSLSEAEDKADESSHDENNSSEIHSFDLLPAG